MSDPVSRHDLDPALAPRCVPSRAAKQAPHERAPLRTMRPRTVRVMAPSPVLGRGRAAVKTGWPWVSPKDDVERSRLDEEARAAQQSIVDAKAERLEALERAARARG